MRKKKNKGRISVKITDGITPLHKLSGEDPEKLGKEVQDFLNGKLG